MPERLPVPTTVVLGVVTIVGFGVWFYGYGVLLEPIRADTGWSEAVLSATYGVSSFGAGVLATAIGRLLQKRSPRLLYALGAPAALAAYLVTAAAGSPAVFAVAGVVAGSVTGALGYYAAVHTVIALLVPAGKRAGAITTNTVWGAFASPIFLPLMAWVVLALDWRATLRLTGALVAVAFLLAAAVLPDVRGGAGTAPPSLRAALGAVARNRVVLALVFTTFAAGVATSLLVLYQVPVMVGAGLTAATASGFAGARGMLQLAGRLPLPWLARRVGSRATLRLSHLLTAAACLVLPFAGRLSVAVLFAVVAGLALGALVPIESIFTADAIPLESLGIVLGVSALTRGIGSALGPVLGGTVSATVGTRTPTLMVAAAAAAAAALLVPRTHPAGPSSRPRKAARRIPGSRTASR